MSLYDLLLAAMPRMGVLRDSKIARRGLFVVVDFEDTRRRLYDQGDEEIPVQQQQTTESSSRCRRTAKKM